MKTVLNKLVIDTTKQPIFLGEDLSLQRYDKFKYEIFMELSKDQWNLFWRPEEINLTKDRADFKNLNDHEKRIFTKNLSYQILMDSTLTRTICKLSDYVSLPEVESCMSVWSMMETLHSYSYTYIVKNVYPNPGEIFDNVLKDEEILARAESVTKEYDQLIGQNGDLKSKIYLSLIATNILEGIRFYISFACAFAFAQNKVMVGNSDIIKLINRDENKHLQITTTILKLLQKHEDEGFQQTIKDNQEIVLKMFRDAVMEEEAWANYIFKDGSILGLNSKILHQYVRWLANTRMKNIGLPQIFETVKNPIEGWIKAWGAGSANVLSTAPQETEITSYLTGASKNDLQDLDLSDFKL